MLLGYNTWSMPTLGIEETVAHLAALGYDSLEMTICPGWPTDAATLDPPACRRLRELIAAHGLVLTGCTGNAPVLADDWPENQARLRRCLEVAGALRGAGQPLYVSTTSGPAAAGADADTAWAACRDQLADRLATLAAHAAACGARLHLEPHVAALVHRADQALWLLDQVSSDAFGLTLDISHFEVQGIDAGATVAALAGRFGAVEVKDERGTVPDYSFLIPGEGDMNYPVFLQALAGAGYDGSVSVEISKFRQAAADYDPLDAAARSYRVLAAAFEQAGVERG
ncbi:MAG: sugar phosphate isomerase/epimerase [Burkholderiales bacterium]|nr:sugar phosphate isomerase/epimerase [Burkholderiales bacterium]